jgi:plastocyanin
MVIVEMVDKSATEFVFEPKDITVTPGQTVRFVQTGFIPHNVEFRDGPDGTDLGPQAMGPFLLATGETYEVVIDDRFKPGTHKYVCTPHELMGMVGTITVESPTH